MKTPVMNHPSSWVTLLCLLFAIQLRAAQFIELTAEIETVDWHSEAVSRAPPWTVRCVVGTNAWRMDGNFFLRQGNSTWSFTGTNLVERTVISDASGTQPTRTFESVDGNPGRPVRTEDLMLLPTARIAWLALCSGPCLKTKGLRLFPPSDLWKEILPLTRSANVLETNGEYFHVPGYTSPWPEGMPRLVQPGQTTVLEIHPNPVFWLRVRTSTRSPCLASAIESGRRRRPRTCKRGFSSFIMQCSN